MPGGGKGGASSTVTVNNGPMTVDADSTVEIVGLDKISVTATLAPTPFKTESKQEIVLPQPLRTETRLDARSDVTSDSKNALSVDLKPVALDVCLNSSTRLPQGQIEQPFSFHVGLTVFGMEWFGMNFGGHSKVILSDLPKQPAIDWPVQQNAAAAPARCRDEESRGPSRHRGHDGGLRVRIR